MAMVIKYISCDGITEVEEEILSAEFYTTEICGKEYNCLKCEKSPNNEYFVKYAKTVGANTFAVDFDKVDYIKVK